MSERSADEGALDHELGRVAERALAEAEALDQFLDVLQHRHRAADHDAVVGRIERCDAEVGVELAALDQPGDAAHAGRDLAGGRRVVGEAAGGDLADQRVVGGLVEQLLAIAQLGMVAAGMGQVDVLELLVFLFLYKNYL